MRSKSIRGQQTSLGFSVKIMGKSRLSIKDGLLKLSPDPMLTLEDERNRLATTNKEYENYNIRINQVREALEKLKGVKQDLDFSELDDIILAYAITIHRSQGSEVPVIVLALHESHTILLERQLIYTGVTRAKKLLILVGTRKALILATKRMRSQRRHTALKERILEELAAEDK